MLPFVVQVFAIAQDRQEVFTLTTIYNPSSLESWADMRQKTAMHFAGCAKVNCFEYNDEFLARDAFPLPDDSKFEDAQKGKLGHVYAVWTVIGKVKDNK